MPVLVNLKNRNLEDVSPNDAASGLDSGSHGIPLMDPSGQPSVASNISEAQNLMQNGYRQLSHEELTKGMDFSKFNTPGQKLAAAAEGAGQGMTFGLSTAAERALGVPGEDILKRQQYHPVLNATGQAAGIGISSLFGLGEAQALNSAGEMGAQAVGRLFGEGALAKVGSVAARNAAQTAMLQGGNEVSRMIAGDPSTTAESAVANIGLAGAMGGAAGAMLGTVPQLWEKSAQAIGTSKVLNAVKTKMAGMDPVTPAGANVDSLLDSAGVHVDPSVRAALGDDPYVRQSFQNLVSKNGEGYFSGKSTAALAKFKEDTHAAILDSIGATPESIPTMLATSDAKAGQAIQSTLVNELRSKSTPLSQTFDQVRSTLKDAVLPQEAKDQLANHLQNLAQGFANLGDESDEFKLLQGAISKISAQNTIQDLRVFSSNYLGKAYNQGLWSIYRPMQKVLRETEADYTQKALEAAAGLPPISNFDRMAIQQANASAGVAPETGLMGGVDPALPMQLKQARAEYSKLMDHVDTLNDRLHVGNYDGPESFIKALSSMAPEKVLAKMTPLNDIGHLQLMTEGFPETGALVKQAYVNDLVQSSARSGTLKPESFFNTLQNKWSPELTNWVIPAESQSRLGALRQLNDAIPKSLGPSGSSEIINYIRNRMTAGAGAVIGHFIPGVGPGGGYLAGKVAGLLGGQVPDAINYAMLHYLGSETGETNIMGFKAMADYFGHAMEAQEMMNSGIAAVINGKPVSGISPNPKADDKLDQSVQDYQEDPSKFFDVGGHIGVYADQHHTAVSQVVARAHSYLSQIRPQTEPLGILDSDFSPSKTQDSAYRKSLSLVNQPLNILNTIKQGNVTPSDLAVMESIYPGLHQQIRSKLTNALIEAKGSGKIIPYQTRLALSTYLGQNLDSTIGPMAMLTLAPKGQGQEGQEQGGPRKQSPKVDKIKKTPQLDQTMTQRAEQDRITPNES